MSLPFVLGVSGVTKQILDHVITYLDALSSSLATKAQQTTMSTNLNTANTNISTLLGRVTTTAADKATLDLAKTDTAAILVDTADMQPRVVTMDSRTSDILTDTAELVTDVNAVLADTAALDARLNSTWSGRLDTTVSSRLSSVVRRQYNVSVTGVSCASGSGIDTRYFDISTGLTNYNKSFFIGQVAVSSSTGVSSRNVGGTTYFGWGRATSNSNLRLSAEASISPAYLSAQGFLIEFY